MTVDEWDAFLFDEEEELTQQNTLHRNSTWPYRKPLPEFIFTPCPVKKNFWRMLFENIKSLI